MAYVTQVEQLDEKEFADFNKELDRDPSLPKRSRGTGDLMRLLAQQGR